MKGWGPKSSLCPVKLFGRDIPGFCWDIPAAPEKFEKKKFVFNFWPQFAGLPLEQSSVIYILQKERLSLRERCEEIFGKMGSKNQPIQIPKFQKARGSPLCRQHEAPWPTCLSVMSPQPLKVHVPHLQDSSLLLPLRYGRVAGLLGKTPSGAPTLFMRRPQERRCVTANSLHSVGYLLRVLSSSFPPPHPDLRVGKRGFLGQGVFSKRSISRDSRDRERFQRATSVWKNKENLTIFWRFWRP